MLHHRDDLHISPLLPKPDTDLLLAQFSSALSTDSDRTARQSDLETARWIPPTARPLRSSRSSGLSSGLLSTSKRCAFPSELALDIPTPPIRVHPPRSPTPQARARALALAQANAKGPLEPHISNLPRRPRKKRVVVVDPNDSDSD
ncbi:hypothetical protein MKEN_00002600 [Mycena kentingensis (nom. inval.)]|nr:hypothetical protein MKEN_00002600 [Mycena kentingensis (nom. inval.)]